MSNTVTDTGTNVRLLLAAAILLMVSLSGAFAAITMPTTPAVQVEVETIITQTTEK